MWIIICTTLIVVIIKGYFVWTLRDAFTSERINLIAVLVGLLFIQHIFDLGGLSLHQFQVTPTFAFTGYYITTLYILHLTLMLVMQVSGYNLRWPGYTTFAIATMLSVLIVGSDTVISGYQSIGYSLTRIPGDYYWCFQLYALSCLSLIVGFLVRGCINKVSPITQVKSIYFLLSLLPILMVGYSTIFLMQLGFPINASALIPIASVSFVACIVYTTRKHELFDIRIIIPGTAEFKSLIDAFKISNDGANNLRPRLRTLESLMIKQALQVSDGNQSLAAKQLGSVDLR